MLEVCDRASASDTNAKEAVRAIRREFKCEPFLRSRISADEFSGTASLRLSCPLPEYGLSSFYLSTMIHLIQLIQLWAIMLRNCSDIFIVQSRQRKFLDTLEELLSSPKTSPVVRERLLEVVAAAAFASGTSESHHIHFLSR